MNRQQRRKLHRIINKEKEKMMKGQKTNLTRIQATVIEDVKINVDGILSSRRAKGKQLDGLYIDWIKTNKDNLFDAIPYNGKFGLYQLKNKSTDEKSDWVFHISELLIGKEVL